MIPGYCYSLSRQYMYDALDLCSYAIKEVNVKKLQQRERCGTWWLLAARQPGQRDPMSRLPLCHRVFIGII